MFPNGTYLKPNMQRALAAVENLLQRYLNSKSFCLLLVLLLQPEQWQG